MKSDQTNLAVSYASSFGYNLRQLVRDVMGEVFLKSEQWFGDTIKHGLIGEKLVGKTG